MAERPPQIQWEWQMLVSSDIISTCSRWLLEAIKQHHYHCLQVWRNTSVNYRYYVYTACGGRHACCDDACCFHGECLLARDY